MPLLYLSRLAPAQDLALDAAVPARIDAAITTLLSRQTSTGAFGLWSADAEANDVWLDAYVSDFLTRAREAGYTVPQSGMDQALDRLRNFVANNAEAKDDDALQLAYAIYVLARNGRPVLGDLHYLAGSRLTAFGTPLAQAQIGAGLALLGDRARAADVFDMATGTLRADKETRKYRIDYGTHVRDAAAVLALTAEAGAAASVGKAGTLLADAQMAPFPKSTQEDAWLVLAAQALAGLSKDLTVTVDGQPHQGALYRTVAARRLADKPVTIANTGPSAVSVVLTTSGQLPAPEPAAQKGYTIERSYYRLDGKPADPASVRQNERFVVVLKVTEEEATQARLLLTDPLPAGFEIDNPDLVAGGTVPNIPGLAEDDADGVKPTHTEFRDDRFTAAFDRTSDQSAFFTVAYVVRAVTPGRFVHPPATIEDMYRPERFGRTAPGRVEVRGE